MKYYLEARCDYFFITFYSLTSYNSFWSYLFLLYKELAMVSILASLYSSSVFSFVWIWESFFTVDFYSTVLRILDFSEFSFTKFVIFISSLKFHLSFPWLVSGGHLSFTHTPFSDFQAFRYFLFRGPQSFVQVHCF